MYYIISSGLVRDANGNYISDDPLSSDWQLYLQWVADGNTPTIIYPASSTDPLIITGDVKVGESVVYNGTTTRVLYNNAGVVGEYAVTGTGSVVMSDNAGLNSPNITGPIITDAYLANTLALDNGTGATGDILETNGIITQWVGSTGTGNVMRDNYPTVSGLTLQGVVNASSLDGENGQFLMSSGTGVQWANARNFSNAIINGDFSVADRGTSFTSSTAFINSDDFYTLDRWYILSDGNNRVEVSQELTEVPTGGYSSCRLRVPTTSASGFKFGIAQIIERRNITGMANVSVKLSFKAKVSSTTKLDNIKAAVVNWTGTADTVTSDIVSAWNVEDTNPTLIGNASYASTPVNLSVTTSWQTFEVEATTSASVKNLIVVIWSDVTDVTAGDFVYLTDVQLERGISTSPFERLPIDVQRNRCMRYAQRMLESTNAFLGILSASNIFHFRVDFKPQMRVPPAVLSNANAYASGASPTANQVAFLNFTADAFTSITGTYSISSLMGQFGGWIRFTVTSTGSSFGDMFTFRFGSAVAIIFDAEL